MVVLCCLRVFDDSSECCNSLGVCATDAMSCGVMCQCGPSGKLSNCLGPVHDPVLPIAAPASVCGIGIARCPQGFCCRYL